MAHVIECDGGCGKRSPDPKTRLHEANHWLRVRAATNINFEYGREDSWDDLLFCKDCSKVVWDALKGGA